MPDELLGIKVQLDAAALRPLVSEIVAECVRQLADADARLPDRLAFTEQEAARLLALKDHQLRDERLRGRIGASRIVGGRIRYQRQDLIDYLIGRRWEKG